MPEEVYDLADAADKLKCAVEAYNKAHEIAEEARRVQTDKLNGLNACQKMFDKAVEQTKKKAGVWNSDWHQAAKNQVV